VKDDTKRDDHQDEVKEKEQQADDRGFIHGNNLSNLGTKFDAWVQNSKRGYKTQNVGTKLKTWVQNSKRGYNFFIPELRFQTTNLKKMFWNGEPLWLSG
jgi:hypothetical protein